MSHTIYLWARISGCHKSLSLIFWTQITYKSFSICWVIFELVMFRAQLTNSQFGSGLKPCLVCELISSRILFDSGEEADNTSREIPDSIASSYRLSTSKVRLSDLKNDLPGPENLLKHKRRLRKVWQLTWDPECKTAVNWVTKTITRMTCRKTLELWETKVGKCEVTPWVLWIIAIPVTERDGSKTPTTFMAL
jgi:hypothetical protein